MTEYSGLKHFQLPEDISGMLALLVSDLSHCSLPLKALGFYLRRIPSSSASY
jgi:hypothetical protein